MYFNIFILLPNPLLPSSQPVQLSPTQYIQVLGTVLQVQLQPIQYRFIFAKQGCFHFFPGETIPQFTKSCFYEIAFCVQSKFI